MPVWRSEPTARSRGMSKCIAGVAMGTITGTRWRQKIYVARLRVQRLGWTDACHCAALEILGYRFNRAAMLRAAGRWPLATWLQAQVNVDEIYAGEIGGWSLQGVRPANHPRT